MNTHDFTGKTVVVTGSQRGIGRAIGERFYKAGANVAFCSVSQTGKEELMQEVAGDDRSRIMAKAVDVTNIEEIAAFFQEVVDAFGGFDILVNNAGVYMRNDILEATEADWNRIIDTDLKSVFFTSQWFCRYHKEAGTPGNIVNIGSINSGKIFPNASLYNVAKVGVGTVTKSFALEMGNYGIRVNSVNPGSIPTDLNADIYKDKAVEQALCEKLPLGRRGTKDDIANCVLFLASDNAAYVTGQELFAEGGWLLA